MFQDEVASEKVTKIRLFAFEIFYRSKVSDLRIAVRNSEFAQRRAKLW
jgi:hypothetical protein